MIRKIWLPVSAALLFALLILFPFEPAFGESGLFVEPAVTYEFGSTSVNYPSPLSSSSGTVDGFGLGARVGFHISEVIFAGLDGRYSLPHYKDSSPYEANATAENLGVVAGIQMPVIGLRVWATYVFAGDLDPSASGSVDVKFSDATGYRIGAGFRVAIVSLNLEYQALKYGTTTLQQVGPFSTNTNFGGVNMTDNAWIAGVSFPLEL